jgi:hypothetical protein
MLTRNRRKSADPRALEISPDDFRLGEPERAFDLIAVCRS